jgi:NAD(P)-dependent dehydrogenase (short-subunit alcohol dehydrogenase family)
MFHFEGKGVLITGDAQGFGRVCALGRPEEIAAATLYLASDEARFVVGEVLVIDGGFTVQ